MPNVRRQEMSRCRFSSLQSLYTRPGDAQTVVRRLFAAASSPNLQSILLSWMHGVSSFVSFVNSPFES